MKHSLTPAEYVARHPDAMLVHPIWKKIRREISVASHWANKPIEETAGIRAVLSENGRRAFQKLNAEGRAWRMPKGYHTEEHKQKMRLLMIGRKCTWGDAIKKSHWVNKTPDEVSKIIEKIQAVDAQIKKTERGYFTSKKMGCTYHYASSFERRRLEFLELNDDVISFDKRHGIKLSYMIDGKCHIYIPDILVTLRNGQVILEEIKGWVRDKRVHDAKCAAAQIFCETNGMTFNVVFEDRLGTI